MEKRRQVLFIAGSLALATLSGVALSRAGQKFTIPVSVDTVNRVARGALGTVRNSASLTERIMCGSDFDSFSCNALDASGVSLACTSDAADPNYAAIRQVVQAIGPDSYVTFRAHTTGYCTDVSVYNGSVYEPKAP